MKYLRQYIRRLLREGTPKRNGEMNLPKDPTADWETVTRGSRTFKLNPIETLIDVPGEYFVEVEQQETGVWKLHINTWDDILDMVIYRKSYPSGRFRGHGFGSKEKAVEAFHNDSTFRRILKKHIDKISHKYDY